MNKIYRKLFFAALPVLLLVAFYVVDDPFKVVWHYHHFYEPHGKHIVELNNEYVAIENYLQNIKEQHHYDSYIIGSSRARNYCINDWKKHIKTVGCYHFDASNENLYGLERIINYGIIN